MVEAFGYCGLEYKKYVEIDPVYYRPSEVDYLLADISKAKRVLSWSPRITFKELVKIMVDSDTRLVGLKPKGEGDAILRAKGIAWTKNIIQYQVPSKE